MPIKSPIVAKIVVGFLILAVLAVFFVYRAATYEPAFYQIALEIDPAVLQQGSDQMLQRMSALLSDVNTKQHWQALFTSDQINGWLAVDLARNHANSLPEGMSDPRVALEPDQITLACRFRQGGISSVLSLTLQPFLLKDKPDVIAIRIVKARAGKLPLPLDPIVKQITNAAKNAGIALQWRRDSDGPVAMIALPTPRDSSDKELTIERLELKADEIYIEGGKS
jgi:hypothetical protein